MAPKPLFQDPASPYSPPSFPLLFRSRSRDSDDGGRHMQTLIQQISNLTIDDYEGPQGDRRQEQRSFVQTTTTTTTTTQPAWMTSQPHNHNRDATTSRLLLPNINPVSPSSHCSSSSTISSPRPAAAAIHHDCCSTSCSNFSGAAARTAMSRHHSKPETSSGISEVSSSCGSGSGRGESPSSPNRYLRTRRGAISGPACPAPAFGGPTGSAIADAMVMDPRAPAPDGQQRFLLPAPGTPRSMMSSDFSAPGGTRAGSSFTAAIRPTTNRMKEARLLQPSSPSNGWIEHDCNNSVASSSKSKSTVRPPPAFGYTAPSPASVSSRASVSRSSHHSPQIRNGEITPHDSISQVGGSSSPASAWALPPAWRAAEGKRSFVSLPGRSLPLSGVRHIPASEVGSRLSPHFLRPQQQENSGWVLPSSTPGRFGPPPPSEFEAGSSRNASHRRFC